MAAHTVATLIETVCQSFRDAGLSYGHGTDNAWDEAVALVLGVTGLADDADVLQQPIEADPAEKILSYAEKRVTSRWPLPYVLGRCQYMGLELKVTPGVVVPRSPIGYLLHEGLEPWLGERVERVLDLCAGCGALGIVAAQVFPSARVTLVELDDTAVGVARENVAGLGLRDRVEVVAGDVGSVELDERFDLIVSNPPYVDARDMQSLPPEYSAEPASGLAAGDDGLAVIDVILGRLGEWLAPGGLFVGEVGASAPALLQRYPSLPFIWPELPHGGEGVFLLEADKLGSHTARDS